jgi:hypothetical protein
MNTEKKQMKRSGVSVEEIEKDQDLLSFIRFPWQIYQNDRYWVPPLIKDQLAKFSPDHPFRSHSKMNFFLAKKDGKIQGRIAGIIDYHHVEYHQEKTGFFGFFESIPEAEVAGALFSEVRDWLKKNGMEKMIGPMNPSTNDECSLLIDGFDSPPCLMMPYNPRYYLSLLEGAGLKKAMDLYAYWLPESSFHKDRLSRIAERITSKDSGLRIRPLDMSHFNEELKVVKEIYNQAWSKNWGFVPMTDAEMDQTAKDLKPLVVPDLVLFAYQGDEPIGFSVAIPDYNIVLKHLNGKLGILGYLKFFYYSRKIHTLRVMLLGVKETFRKRGVEGLLIMETLKRGPAKGYPQAECSWVLENNLIMQSGLEGIGGKRYKTYRVYEMDL